MVKWLSEKNEGDTIVKNQKATTVVVTRVFTEKTKTLFDLYANYVAKRIMFESGMIHCEEENTSENDTPNPLDINDLMW